MVFMGEDILMRCIHASQCPSLNMSRRGRGGDGPSVDTGIRVNNEMDLLPSTVEPLLQPHHLSTNPPDMENFLEENERCIRGSGTILASAAINYCSGEVRQGEVGLLAQLRCNAAGCS